MVGVIAIHKQGHHCQAAVQTAPFRRVESWHDFTCRKVNSCQI